MEGRVAAMQDDGIEDKTYQVSIHSLLDYIAHRPI